MLAAIAMLGVAALYVAYRLNSPPAPTVDFTPIWLAGAMWNQGLDPYGPHFAELAGRLFPPPAHTPVSWVYPGQWVFIARFFALFDYETARQLWIATSLTALAAGCTLFWRASDRLPVPPPLLIKAGAIALLLTMQSTTGALYLGQTTPLLLLGLGLVIHGALSNRPAEVIAGEIILLLKPQYGLVIGAAAMAFPQLRWPMIVAGLVTLISFAIGYATPLGPLSVSLSEWLNALASYNGNRFNLPSVLTGAIQLETLSPGVAIPVYLYTLAAALALPLAIFIGRRHGRAGLWMTGFCMIAVIVPLHNYDLSFTATLLLFWSMAGWPVRAALLLGSVAIHRAGAIGQAAMPGFDILQSQAIAATIGIAAIAIGAALWMRKPQPA